MTHSQHVRLIKGAITSTGGIWADLGSGEGAFTLALRDLLGDSASIFSIDNSVSALEAQKKHFNDLFPNSHIRYLTQDFTTPLELPLLDGILMANSLHYVLNQTAFLLSIKNYLKPNGYFVLVEYNSSTGNRWVPFPLSFERFAEIAHNSGFERVNKTGSVPSTFLHEMYSAVALKKDV